MTRTYPDEPVDEFPSPPATFADDEGREVTVRTGGGADHDALAEMYEAFDPADRAQGIPPTGESDVREWLESLTDDGVGVLARHDGAVVGHAVLVPDRHGDFELAIFVLRAYQQAGIGTGLLGALLGAGREAGVECIWLTVERWNAPAIALYRKMGFEASGTDSFELEMAARLAD